MKKCVLLYIMAAMCLFSLPAFSQTGKDTAALLNLPGDNLDLYAVLTLFQKSKTIEAFEKSLNDEKTAVNNLDLDLNKKIDFIKVVTKKKDESYSFILQVDVSKTETQDVAVILVDKDQNKKVSIQIVGDEELYGKDYVIEPKGNSSVTANPGYTGNDPVTKDVPATTTVVVESAPIVQYVYSPAYVPYVPPYYYGYYPPYFALGACIAVGIYRSNNWGYHGGYYGGHYGGGNTVIINNKNNYNNYNNNKMKSNTVANNKAKGNYGGGDRASGRPSAGTSDRTSGGASGRPSSGSDRPSAGTSDRSSGGSSNRPSAGTSDRSSGGASARPSTGSDRSATSNRSSYSAPSSRSRSSGGGSGGFSGGGGARGGGGGGRRR